MHKWPEKYGIVVCNESDLWPVCVRPSDGYYQLLIPIRRTLTQTPITTQTEPHKGGPTLWRAGNFRPVSGHE